MAKNLPLFDVADSDLPVVEAPAKRKKRLDPVPESKFDQLTLESITTPVKDQNMESLSDIQKQIAELQAKERNLTKQLKGDALAKIAELMATFGIKVEEIKAPKAVKATDSTDEKTPRKKAAPKYKDPATGKTWAGRGMRPKWVTEDMAL